MTESVPRQGVRVSIFARLVAIILSMAAVVMIMVTGFFFGIVFPGIHVSINELFRDYARAVAASSPGLEDARRIGKELDMEMRYTGPAGEWTTDDALPTIETVRARQHVVHSPKLLRTYYLVPAPQGGDYLFARRLSARFHAIRHDLLVLLLLLMTGVFVIAYVVLRRTLRPLRWLTDGVERLSQGELDVVVENPTRDEFGTLTQAFNRMARRVKEMVQARDQLLLDVSHELRSPLTRMKVALALQPDSPARASMAADVSEMEMMVSELLELERLREGRGLRPERRDLAPVLREIIAVCAGRSPGVRLTGEVPEMPLDFDVEKVRTVFRNLIENALKYSLPDSRAVEVSVSRDAQSVVVCVTDDGPGIPEGDPANLFEPFVRHDRSRSKKTGGYGLGLSICKRIMEAHGGSIDVERNAGRGATFVVTFAGIAGIAGSTDGTSNAEDRG